ncbi:MAG: thiolase family protein [Actinomycetes bacterium]
MRDAVIVDAVRTPVGRRNGALCDVHPVDLSAVVLEALVTRNGLDPADVDDVIWGCVDQVGEQSLNVARYAALAAGWPESVVGVTIDRQCGSSQQAVHFAAAGVLAGHYDLVVAGGVESMSRVPLGANAANGPGFPYGPRVMARYGGVPFDQGVGAEMLAERWGLGRTVLDEHALASHEKAAAATDAGGFAGQIVPVEAAGQRVAVDEGIRRSGSLEVLAGLPTPFRADGVITAASSSQISDGAAAVLVTSSGTAARLGLSPMARVHAVALAGVDPVSMLTGPIPATAKVLARAGLSIDDIGTFEVNEAFASVTLAWSAETGADPDRLNPQGGAIALGHPLGASGARLMTTMVHRMREQGIRYGLQAMCEGGGMANATILERLGG